jgi:DNA repair photolyase
LQKKSANGSSTCPKLNIANIKFWLNLSPIIKNNKSSSQMETTAAKVTEQVTYKFKEVRKEIAAKLEHALTDAKNMIGAEKLSKHIKKLSKSVAEEIVKTAHKQEKAKKEKSKKVKVKKEAKKK